MIFYAAHAALLSELLLLSTRDVPFSGYPIINIFVAAFYVAAWTCILISILHTNHAKWKSGNIKDFFPQDQFYNVHFPHLFIYFFNHDFDFFFAALVKRKLQQIRMHIKIGDFQDIWHIGELFLSMTRYKSIPTIDVTILTLHKHRHKTLSSCGTIFFLSQKPNNTSTKLSIL